MNKKLHLIIYILVMLASLTASGQDGLRVLAEKSEQAKTDDSTSGIDTPRHIYNQAESEYNIGRIEHALSLLQDNIDSFQGDLRQSVLRLMVLCCLSEDREEEARQYARQLIRLNNYYNAVGDPPRFQDLISQLKGGITRTITTASSQSESINEAPSPITIITADMIEELGYNKNLNQILAAYVPGMVEICSFDEGVNLSMHGAHAMGQELILIMENGHRLNTRFDNIGPTDYSISTEKIDHIEVLRGPASSLYGNVAVSAVVNIITKSGRETNGVKVKYGNATYGTHKADFTIGTQFMNSDIFAWASFYKSDGQKRNFSDGEGYYYYEDVMTTSIEDGYYYKSTYYYPEWVYVGGYKDKPAYDVGLTFKLNGFELMFSRKNVKKIQQTTLFFGGYDYDKYYPADGVKPGKGIEETHAEIGYTRQIKNIHLNGSVYCDWYDISDYEASYDSVYRIQPVFDDDWNYTYDENGNVILYGTAYLGNFVYEQSKERTIGGFFKASANYTIGKMKGNGLAGIQYEHFKLLSNTVINGKNFREIGTGYLNSDSYENGNEKNLSFFMQGKHYFVPKLILNTGFRYDLKYRHKEDVVRTFSPRLALMYVPHDRFSLKLSYSEAFADLSYYFRTLSGGRDFTMDPQHLSAIQLTTMGTISPMHLHYEVNLFYNKYSNLLSWQVRDNPYDSEVAGKNIGYLKNMGIEGLARYDYKRLSAYISAYFCHDIDGGNFYYNSSKNMVNGVPHFTLNLHGAWKLVQSKSHEVKVYGHSIYTGRKLNFQLNEEDDFYVDGKMLFDLGIKYCFKQRLQVSFDCENILNTDHYICGPNIQDIPHFQRGRSLMASISYHI